MNEIVRAFREWAENNLERLEKQGIKVMVGPVTDEWGPSQYATFERGDAGMEVIIWPDSSLEIHTFLPEATEIGMVYKEGISVPEAQAIFDTETRKVFDL